MIYHRSFFQVTGGSDGTDVLTSMEVFNTKKQSWEERSDQIFNLFSMVNLWLIYGITIFLVGGLENSDINSG